MVKNNFLCQAYYLVFIFCFSWTPVWNIFVGSYFYVVLIASCIYIVLCLNDGSVDRKSILLSISIVIVFLLLALITMSHRPIARFIMLPISILLVSATVKNTNLMSVFIDKITIFALFSTIASIISFLYVFNGGNANFYIENSDSRLNWFYLTSFSNYKVGNVIRPSFIYDEPGAFSFLLCFIVFLRECYNKNKNISFLIMFLGLVTFSLAHLFVFFCFVFYKMRDKLISIFMVFIPLIFFVFTNPSFNFFTERFNFESGSFAGDNRTSQIHNFRKVLNKELFIFGNIHCSKRQNGICKEDGDISSSIVTPIYTGGIFSLFVQLFVHLYLIFVCFKYPNNRFVAVALTFLLLQRPFFLSEAYSLMIFLVIGVLMVRTKNNL